MITNIEITLQEDRCLAQLEGKLEGNLEGKLLASCCSEVIQLQISWN